MRSKTKPGDTDELVMRSKTKPGDTDELVMRSKQSQAIRMSW